MVSCIFCFFKQKTAYEMRISDWSSDVCSSDLGDPFLQNIHGYLESMAAETGETALLAVREHAAVIYVDVVESSSPIRYSAKVGDRRSLFTASSGKAIQIGRASCRERVCQYV